MSQLFDLNVNNYSLTELLNFFGVDKNDDEAQVERSCNELKKKIQSDPKLGPMTKGKINEFLNKAIERIAFSRNTTKELIESNSTSTTKPTVPADAAAGAAPKKFMQLKNNIEQHGDSFLITRPSIQAGITANFSNGSTILSGAPPGIVNPVAINTIKRALNVDTRFRSNYYSTKSTDFVYNIPYKFENVTRMSMATYEMPLTYYAISQQYENNCIIFQWKNQGVNYYNSHYTLLIPDGNYNASFQSGNGSSIENAINGILAGTEIVKETGLSYTVDRTSGRSIFSCNSATDASGNVFPYTPSSSITYDMVTPTLTVDLDMHTPSTVVIAPPSLFPSGDIIWNNSIQTLSTELYFSTLNRIGNPVDLSNYDTFCTLNITDGVNLQAFEVLSSVVTPGSDYWTVTVRNGIGATMPTDVPVKATFTRLPPTIGFDGVPSYNVWWGNAPLAQIFTTVLAFSVTSLTTSVDLTPFSNNNSRLTITDGTNTQTFSVGTITDAGFPPPNNFWVVKVSNGTGTTIAYGTLIKATFTTVAQHTPFTGSMRIVFNSRAGINRDPESNVVNVGIGTSSQSDTRPLPSFLGWQLGYRTAIYQMDGGVDSTGSTTPGIPQSAISEGICLITGPQYVFLCIDDYNNSVNNYYATAYGSSTIAPNIIARLNIKQQINATGAYGVIAGESLSTSLTYSREYFGPVDIQRIRVTLIDDFGRVLDLNNMDWSFALMFECVYNSSMA